MKTHYLFHPDQGYVVITLEGRVQVADLGALIETVWADPGWKADYNGILDCGAATLEFSEREIVELSQSMQKDPRCSMGRWAFVVATASDFGKIRKVDHPVDLKSTVRIFFDRRSAEAWLLSGGGPR